MDCCSQLAVQVVSVTPNRPASSGPGRRDRGLLLVADFRVHVFGCFPLTPDPPPAQMIEDATSALDGQAWGAYNSVMQEIRTDTLFPPGCRLAQVATLSPVEVSGGCGGYTFDVSCQIDGFDIGP